MSTPRSTMLPTLLALSILLHSAAAASDGVTAEELAYRKKIKIAHGIVAGLAFAVLFPLGGALVSMFNYKGKMWVHAGVQILALVLAVVGLGLGIRLALVWDSLVTVNGHTIIGIVVIATLCVMPALGWLHYLAFAARGRRSAWSYAHIWLGRVMIVLGGINGGLGLQISTAIRGSWLTVYVVLAAIFYGLWFGVAAWDEWKKCSANRPRVEGGERLEKRVSAEDDAEQGLGK